MQACMLKSMSDLFNLAGTIIHYVEQLIQFPLFNHYYYYFQHTAYFDVENCVDIRANVC